MRWSKLVIFAFLLGIVLAPKAHEQVTIDIRRLPATNSCNIKSTNPRFLALWLSGYYAGMRKNPIVDVEKIEGNADRVSAYCDIIAKRC